jgi:hypothetical protein
MEILKNGDKNGKTQPGLGFSGKCKKLRRPS